jgi:transcriptional regulator with XRE-family HTH domain
MIIILIMKKQARSKLHKLRKAHKPPLTLQELARKAGVSYTTVWNLENGLDETVHPDIKDKIANVLGVSTIALLASEAARVDPFLTQISRALEYINDQVQETMLGKELHQAIKKKIDSISRYHRLSTLLDFCPRLEFKYETDAVEILRKMTPNELGTIYRSGLTPDEVIRLMNRIAGRLGLRPVQLKRK